MPLLEVDPLKVSPDPNGCPAASAELAPIRGAAFCGRGWVRPTNEDNLSVDGALLTHEHFREVALANDGDHLLLVADGMGGHARGEVASRIVVDSLNACWRYGRPEFDATGYVRAANERVYAEMAKDGACRGMGATVAGLHIRGADGAWFNVGDSRLYHHRDGRMRQVSVDHVPRDDRWPGRPRSHRVTRSIGGASQPVDVQPSLGHIRFEPRDRILLCTDGLTDVLADDAIAAILAASATACEATLRLKAAVFAAGAPDNVTCLLLER